MASQHLWQLRGACLLQVMAMGLFSTFEAVHMADSGLRPATIGGLLALENGLFILFSPWWGGWADRTGRYRRLIAAGTVASALNLVLFAWAHDFWSFTLYAVIRGVAAPGIQSLMPTLAVGVIGPSRPGRGFGRYRAFGSIGFMLGTGLLPMLAGDLATTCLLGAGGLLGSLALVFRLPRRTGGDRENDLPLPAIAHRGGVSAFLFVYFVLVLTEPGVHGFFGAYARDLGADVSWVGQLASMTGLMALIGLPTVGGLIDRVGAQTILLGAFAAQAARMAATALITDYDWLWLAHLFHVLAWPGREVGAIILLTSLVPVARRARTLAMLASVRMAGMTVGSALMGQLVERLGYRGMYAVMSAVGGTALILFLLLRQSWTARGPLSKTQKDTLK